MNQELFIKQLISLVSDESDIVANLSNTSALLNEYLNDINWVGFYLYDGNELVLGPFQGKVACIRIPLDKGVCGKVASQRKTEVVPNVHEFPGHIPCDGASNSEIVLPILKDDKLIGVLDIDSPIINRFSKDDEVFLEEVRKVIETYIY